MGSAVVVPDFREIDDRGYGKEAKSVRVLESRYTGNDAVPSCFQLERAPKRKAQAGCSPAVFVYQSGGGTGIVNAHVTVVCLSASACDITRVFLCFFSRLDFFVCPTHAPYGLCFLQESMREADADSNGVISFAELVSLMHRLKKDPSSASSVFVRKIRKAPAQVCLCANVVEAGVLGRRRGVKSVKIPSV